MSVTRLAIPGQPITLGLALIAPKAAHHARVARVAPGESVELLDLDGAVGIGRLSRWEGSACWVEVDRVERERGSPLRRWCWDLRCSTPRRSTGRWRRPPSWGPPRSCR